MEKTVLYLLLLIGAANSLSDIATLRKENEILCITGDVTLPTFISPPCIENSTKSLSLLTGEDWSYDNWILTDGSKSLSGSVTDKRWENFEVIKTNYKTFNFVQSLSLSIYSPEEVELFVKNDQQHKAIILKDCKQKWCHISTFSRNNIFFYLDNDVKSVPFNPYQINVKTKNDTFWKIHDCEYPNTKTMT
jgi:hypothetical protein